MNAKKCSRFQPLTPLAVADGFLTRGDFLVYDNASVHFGSDTILELQDYLEENGITTIRLPAYSPELNPIERCFGIIKHFLRYNRDTSQPLINDIIRAFGIITPEIIANEYQRSVFYLLFEPLTLPPHLQEILNLPDVMELA